MYPNQQSAGAPWGGAASHQGQPHQVLDQQGQMGQPWGSTGGGGGGAPAYAPQQAQQSWSGAQQPGAGPQQWGRPSAQQQQQQQWGQQQPAQHQQVPQQQAPQQPVGGAAAYGQWPAQQQAQPSPAPHQASPYNTSAGQVSPYQGSDQQPQGFYGQQGGYQQPGQPQQSHSQAQQPATSPHAGAQACHAPYQQPAWPQQGQQTSQQPGLPQQVAAPAWGQQPSSQPQERVWVGRVTQTIPPNYGIVDGDAFYVTQCVKGNRQPVVGDEVRCKAIPNLDGGQYTWRCIEVEVPTNNTQPVQAPIFGGPATARPGAMAGPVASAALVMSPPPAGPGGRPAKFNAAPPPATIYSAEVALAAAAQAVEAANRAKHGGAAPPPVQPPPRGGYGVQLPQLSEAERQRSAAAMQQRFGGDPALANSIGARLLGKMGFGAAEDSKGGLGRNEHGIAAPVDARGTVGSTGLGFGDREKEGLRPLERGVPRRPSPPRRRPGSERRPSRGRSVSRSRSRSRSHSRRHSPERRYVCAAPKFPTTDVVRGIPSLSKRYKDLYIPSDFAKLVCRWAMSDLHDTYPLTQPLSFTIAKDVEASEPTPVAAPDSALSPAQQATGRHWSAKVVLLSGLDPERAFAAEAKIFQHPARKMQFLMGRRGGPKGELCAIGGGWEPCDGNHPEADPAALVATAKRTFRDATGIDLSVCTRWEPFAEYSYLRSAGKDAPEHTERTVLFLVDAWTLAQPDASAAEAIAKAKEAPAAELAARKEAVAADEAEASAAKELAEVKEASEAADKAAAADGKTLPPPDISGIPEEVSELSVAQLQEELKKRALDAKWTPLKGKKELVDRLQTWVDTAREEWKAVNERTEKLQAAEAVHEAAKKRAKDAEKAARDAKQFARDSLKLLEGPPPGMTIEVRPNPGTSKNSRFTAQSLSLEELLRYTEDDTKESVFEVALFAEQFKEMLETRCGRGLLRCLYILEKQANEAKAKKQAERKARKEAERKEREAAKAKKTAEKAAEGKADGDQADGGHLEAKSDALGKADGGATGAMDPEAAAKPDAAQDSAGDTTMPDAPEANGKVESDHDTVEAASPKSGSKTWQHVANGTAPSKKRAAVDKGDSTAPAPSPTKRLKTEEDAGGAAGNVKAQPATQAAAASGMVKTEEFAVEAPAQPATPLQPGNGDTLGFVARFFDRSCAGVLEGDDIEEIAFMTAPPTSRRRVQALTDAITKRGRLSYGDHLAMPVPGASDAERAAARPPTALVQIAAADAAPTPDGTHPNGAGDAARSGAGAADLAELQKQLAGAQTAALKAKADGLAAAEAKEASDKARDEAAKQVAALQEQLAEAASAQDSNRNLTERSLESLGRTEASLQTALRELAVLTALMGGNPD